MFDNSKLKACGEDVWISPSVEIKRPHLVTVGSHVAIDSGFYLTTGAEIGDYIHIGPYVSVIGGATGLLRVGHFCTIAAGSRLICGSDEFKGAGLVGSTIPKEFADNLIIEPIILERFASLCTNVVVMPGVTIAEGCVIGAGSVVTKSTDPWTIYTGSPAKPLQIRPREKMLEYAKRMGY